MKLIRRVLAGISMFAVVASFAAVLTATTPVYALTTAQQEACQAIGNTADCTDKTTGNSNGDLSGIIKLIVTIVSILVGVVAVIMIIWGGMKYITSGGESSKITGAKNTIIYALIGLVIVALAQFIVKFVLAKSTTITQ